MTHHRYAPIGKKFVLANAEMVVGEKCDSSAPGFWTCTDHGETFPNNASTDSHAAGKSCELAWLCTEHGVEVA